MRISLCYTWRETCYRKYRKKFWCTFLLPQAHSCMYAIYFKCVKSDDLYLSKGWLLLSFWDIEILEKKRDLLKNCYISKYSFRSCPKGVILVEVNNIFWGLMENNFITLDKINPCFVTLILAQCICRNVL